MSLEALDPAARITGFTAPDTSPTLFNPALTIITPMMAMTALELSPVKVALESKRLSSGSDTIISMATTSTRTHSTMKRNTATKRIAITMSLVKRGVLTLALTVTEPLSWIRPPSDVTSGADRCIRKG